jgi:hypothetical protein
MEPLPRVTFDGGSEVLIDSSVKQTGRGRKAINILFDMGRKEEGW